MEYCIRPILQSDAKDVHALRRMPGVMENILGMPSEALSKSEAFLATVDGQNSHQFVAVVTDANGKELVIGIAGLTMMQNPRLRHSASFGIMVHKEYQGLGVGKKLMDACLDLADNWLMLVRVELSVYTTNSKAVALYEKMGFVVEGTKKKAAIRLGEYADEYMMARVKE